MKIFAVINHCDNLKSFSISEIKGRLVVAFEQEFDSFNFSMTFN